MHKVAVTKGGSWVRRWVFVDGNGNPIQDLWMPIVVIRNIKNAIIFTTEGTNYIYQAGPGTIEMRIPDTITSTWNIGEYYWSFSILVSGIDRWVPETGLISVRPNYVLGIQ